MSALRTLVLAFAVVPVLVAQETTRWSAREEFSSSQNTSGPWSYGWSFNRGAPFNALSRRAPFCGTLQGWSNQFPQYPSVAKNETGVTICCTSVHVPPGEIVLHPGEAGENAVLRFTCPEDGSYLIEVDFAGLDFRFPTNSDVAVLFNLQPLFASELNQYDGPVSCAGTGHGVAFRYTGVVEAFQGDTIDFNVGFGFMQRFNGDTTLVDPVIRRVEHTYPVGTSCPGVAQLQSTRPRHGFQMSISLLSTYASAPGALLFAIGETGSTPLGQGCVLRLPPGPPEVLPLVTNGLGTWGTNFPIPNDRALHGLKIACQVVLPDPSGPFGVAVSNGMQLIL